MWKGKYNMEFIGEATFMGTSLEFSSRDVQWSILIRGVDGENDSQFMEYHEKSVTAQDVVKFLPNWKDLVWQRISDSMFSKSVSHAEDSIYEIDLSATRDSSLSHEDVITAFEAFMASSP
jgi:hypothetical protein